MADFVAAYNRSRFWHGNKNGNINEIAQTGLLVSKSDCYPQSVRPEYGGVGGGIICLGTTFGTSEDYGPGSVARVFLNASRAKSLAGNAGEGYSTGSFRQGNDQFWRDTGAAQAVATWADIPADCIWVGTLTDLCKRPADDAKCVAIFGNIVSFDDDLPKDVAALKELMMKAVQSGALTDTVDEKMKNPILPSVGPKTVAVSSGGSSGSGRQKRCIIM